MILVIDVGNTNIVLGLYEQRQLKYHWRISTNKASTVDEYGMLMHQLLAHQGIREAEIEGVMISSVVPPLMFTLEKLSRKYFKREPIVVGPGIKTGLNIKIENPREIGADRIVNAVAGIDLYGTPLIIVDFGTATTYCYIDEQGQYLGGLIAPGIGISAEALYQHAAKLPRIELTKPKQVVGKNTVASMQAGIVYGYAGQVDGIVERICQETGTKPKVIATGGLATMIANETKTIDEVDPFLTLHGLLLLYERNASEGGQPNGR